MHVYGVLTWRLAKYLVSITSFDLPDVPGDRYSYLPLLQKEGLPAGREMFCILIVTCMYTFVKSHQAQGSQMHLICGFCV